MRKRKKREYFKTEKEFKESLIKTPKTQLSAVALAVRYNTKGNNNGR